MNTKKNVYAWLDEVRKRPGMYLLAVDDLQWQIFGYYAALHLHGISENVPSMNHHFLIWLRQRTGWGTSSGWAPALREHFSDLSAQLESFFGFVDEYRKLVPETVFSLDDEKNTRKDQKLIRAEIVQYTPEPLHFIRYHYEDHSRDGWILMKPGGSHETDLQFARETLEAEIAQM